jgi:neutral/alkaline ceramidase-like enzyme
MPKSLRLLFLLLASAASCLGQSPLQSDLRVGAASVEIQLPLGVPLAGYGSAARRTFPYVHGYDYAKFFKPSANTHDSVRAKSMVLIRGNKKLLFISLDIAGVTSEMFEDVLVKLAPLGYQRDQMFVAATHTHSGPGTLSRIWLWQLLASDRFQDKIYVSVLDDISASVRSAEHDAKPAQLFAVSFSAQGMQRNRRHRDGWFDPTANLLLAKSTSGEWLGALVNFAVHGTALNAHNLELSADLPGGIERELQNQLHAPVLFINGAEGDVSPAEGGFQGIDSLSRSFARQAMQALPNARPIQPSWSVRNSTMQLGDPAVTLGACLSPNWHRRIGNWIVLGLGESVPRAITLSYLQIGDLRMFAWPGEPTTTLGFDLKRAAPGAWVLGLTNGYQGYFTSPGEFAEGRYEACSSLYGPEAGERIVRTFSELAQKPQ